MKKIVDSLKRLFSFRNLTAIAIAYFFEVRIAYLIFNIVYFLLDLFFRWDMTFHWIVSEHMLDVSIRLVFVAQLVVVSIAHLRTEIGTRPSILGRMFNASLTIIVLISFACMAVLYIPSMLFVLWLRKKSDTHPWVWFVIDLIYKLLSHAAVFFFAQNVTVTGVWPKRVSFWKRFKAALPQKNVPVAPVEPGYYIELDHEGTDYFIYEAETPLHTRTVCGTNLFWYPVIGQFFEAKCIGIDRKNPDPALRKKVGDEMKQSVANGWNVAVASSGGRKRMHEGVLRKSDDWEDGMYVLAKRYKRPVVPVSIYGTGQFKPPLRGVAPPPPKFTLKTLVPWLRWLAVIATEYQWYFWFNRIYFDICEEFNPEDYASVEELKQAVYCAMERKKLWRMGEVEREKEEYGRYAAFLTRVVFFLLFITFLLCC